MSTENKPPGDAAGKNTKKPTSRALAKSDDPTPAGFHESLRKATESMQQLLQPLIDFHTESADAADDDLKMFWDVRLVRGSGRPFLNTSGVTTITAALSGSAARMLTSVLQDEVFEKIARPLVSKAQDMIGPIELDRLTIRATTKDGPAQVARQGQPFVMDIDDAIQVAAAATRGMGEVHDV